MRAEVVRNRETGEFTAMLGSYELARGKSGPAVARVHDIVEEVNHALACDVMPEVVTTGHGDTREFKVIWGGVSIDDGLGAIKAYRLLDKMEKAYRAAKLVGGSHPDTPLGNAIAERDLKDFVEDKGPLVCPSPAMSEKIEADLQDGESSRAEPAAEEDPFADE